MKRRLAPLSLIVVLAAPAAAGDALRVGWMIAWGKHEGFPRTVEQTSDPKTFTLPVTRWSCSVGPVTAGAQSAFRKTTCRKGAEELEFSTVCDDKKRPFSRSQVRFKDAAGKGAEFVSVECDTAAKPFQE